MKKTLYILLTSVLSLSLFYSCDYLDIVPDEIPTESDAFKDMQALQRYLYSCYSFIPNPRNTTASLDLFTADEVALGITHETFVNFPNGNYTASNPVISYWDDLFMGIRQCYLLLDNIESVPGIESNRAIEKSYRAEATFLIAYYHFLLLRSYGPIMIIEQLPDINMPVNEYPGRKPYDECVRWIADKFDEAVAMGLEPYQYSDTRYYGRATAAAAKCIKARMLLYAASPLFNGQQAPPNAPQDVIDDAALLRDVYAAFVDRDGQKLFASGYDAQKWKDAAAAAREAIEFCDAEYNGRFRLATVSDVKETYEAMTEPADPTQRSLRMTLINNQSPEIIWADTRSDDLTYGLQPKSAPGKGENGGWNCIAPTIAMLEHFYSANGLPIDKDPNWNNGALGGYDGRYGYSAQANGYGNTLNLNQNREPRFEAWIAYHNAYYEYNLNGNDKVKMSFKKSGNAGIGSRTTNYSPTGYLNKKGQHPLNSKGSTSGGSVRNYPWSVVRLAELYLNYAEALIEVGDGASLALAVQYIDKVRVRAGIPRLADAWTVVNLNIATDQNALREVVRQERTIEFYLENQRFWDVRRWMQGTLYFNKKVKGLGINSDIDRTFFAVNEIDALVRRFVAPRNYLMPLPMGDLNKNQKLVQNPGY